MNNDLIDKFGKIVDEYLKENEIKMVIEMPKDSMEAKVFSNMNSSVFDLYILLYGLTAVIENLIINEGILDGAKTEQMLDEIMKIVKHDILEDIKAKTEK